MDAVVKDRADGFSFTILPPAEAVKEDDTLKNTQNTLTKSRDFIRQNGRLLERTLFSYFFENGSKEACVRALKDYQNADGGFGNGIEPDLLCPDSTAIGAETALYILDLLDENKHDMVYDINEWAVNVLGEDGYIKHPPVDSTHYPHQPWWKKPDDTRIFSVLALLEKLGVRDEALQQRVMGYAESFQLSSEPQFYDYPYFLYLLYCREEDHSKGILGGFYSQLPQLIDRNKNHYPLFSRYWYCFIDKVNRKIADLAAAHFLENIQEDGGITHPYPELPWWRPIFTLDGLMILRKHSYI